MNHGKAGHAERSAIGSQGEGVRNGVLRVLARVEVNKRADVPGFAKVIGGIVVMGGVEAEVADGDIGVEGAKFAQGNKGADAVVSSGAEEADVERKVNGELGVMGAEEIEGMTKIKGTLIAVPAPVGIGVGEMALTRAAGDTAVGAVADFTAIRGSMGMDAGAVAGKGEPIRRNETVAKGRKQSGKAEDVLKTFFKMEGEIFPGESVSGQGVGNAGMGIGKLLTFARGLGRLCVLVLREEVRSAGFLRGFGLSPEPIDQVKVRAKGRKGIGGTANEQGKQGIGLKPFDPEGKAGAMEQSHKDKGAKDLRLVLSGSAGVGIEGRKIVHDGIEIEQAQFFADRGEFKMKPGTLRRVQVGF